MIRKIKDTVKRYVLRPCAVIAGIIGGIAALGVDSSDRALVVCLWCTLFIFVYRFGADVLRGVIRFYIKFLEEGEVYE